MRIIDPRLVGRQVLNERGVTTFLRVSFNYDI